MKQTLLSRLILAGLAGAALSAAHAGQIQSSSVAIAREVITSDTQAVTSPSIAYRFAGDVDARVQAQTFQIQFILGAGTWGTLPAAIATAISVSDGVSGVLQDQSAVAPANGAVASYQVGTVSRSTDNKTLFATITVAQSVNALIKQPLFSLNVGSNNITGATVAVAAAARAPVTGLYTVAGDIVARFNAAALTDTPAVACLDNKTLPVSFQHFTALTAPTALATAANATADEHTRGGATNTATLIVFPTNILPVVTASTNAAFLTPGGNRTFSNNAAGGTSFLTATTALLGDVKLTQNALGYDSNLTNQYLLAGSTPPGGTGLSAVAVAAGAVGNVEVQRVDVRVTASNGFVVGGTLQLSTNATCTALVAGTLTAITAANAAGPITVTVPLADVNATFGAATGTATASLCYIVPGTVTIPSSSFSATATVVKAAAGGTNFEQNNVCRGPLYSLGGGLKIDVRNYASSAEAGYQSILRFINNSDTAPADVWAQFVHQNGNLGNWAKIADVPVRGALNMTAAQIDAKLAAGATATAAVGTAGPVRVGPVVGNSTDTAPRLRITSTTGRSLRVQNYLFNSVTGQILEASNQQGVDFEGAATRAPASEGQYQDQDANSGLNLGN